MASRRLRQAHRAAARSALAAAADRCEAIAAGGKPGQAIRTALDERDHLAERTAVAGVLPLSDIVDAARLHRSVEGLEAAMWDAPPAADPIERDLATYLTHGPHEPGAQALLDQLCSRAAGR